MEEKGDGGVFTDSPTHFYCVLSGAKEQLTKRYRAKTGPASHQQRHEKCGVPPIDADIAVWLYVLTADNAVA